MIQMAIRPEMVPLARTSGAQGRTRCEEGQFLVRTRFISSRLLCDGTYLLTLGPIRPRQQDYAAVNCSPSHRLTPTLLDLAACEGSRIHTTTATADTIVSTAPIPDVTWSAVLSAP
jgi:hypothetical protein